MVKKYFEEISEKMKNKKKDSPLAIVFGRNYTTRLCLIRAAGIFGCEVVSIQTQRNQKKIQRIDSSSKFVVESRICNEPNQEELINLILSYKNEDRKIVLLPADDYAAATIDSNMQVLGSEFLMPHINHTQGAIVKLMDKSYQKKIAERVGLNVVNSWIANYQDGVYSIPENILFPCFIKPIECYSCGPLKKYLVRCDTEEQLKTTLRDISKVYKSKILIEEFKTIEKEYAILGLSLGNYSVIPSIIQMKLFRQGLTASGCIYPISRIPKLQDLLCQFMKETQLTGLFDIDMYESEGELYFNELNVRYGASGFALNKVINLPGAFINYLLTGEKFTHSVIDEFKEYSFVSEKVIRDMYYDDMISYKDFKSYIKDADILSLKYDNDNDPYKTFCRIYSFLPLRKRSHLVKMWIKKGCSMFKVI